VHDAAARHMPGEPAESLRRPAGALEAEVMAVFRAAEAPLSPGQVRARRAVRPRGALSHSARSTCMSRLHAKACWRARRARVRHAGDRPAWRHQMSQALDAGVDHGAVLTRQSGLSGRDAGAAPTAGQ
jgi:hypothetical protein